MYVADDKQLVASRGLAFFFHLFLYYSDGVLKLTFKPALILVANFRHDEGRKRTEEKRMYEVPTVVGALTQCSYCPGSYKMPQPTNCRLQT